MSDMGRKTKVSKAKLLKAIHDYKTTSASTLAKKLTTHRATIYRALNKLTHEEISEALGTVTETQLKPAEMEYKVFEQIPIVKDFYETLRFKRENSEGYSRGQVRYLFRVCLIYKVRPKALRVEQAEALVLSIKKGEQAEFGSGYDVRRAMRSWFGFRGVSTTLLTNKGIHARAPKASKARAHARFTQEHRHAILAIAKEKMKTNWISQKRKSITINFLENPQLKYAMEQWFKFKYYTMTRLTATLQTTWEMRTDENGGDWGVTWKEDMVIIHLMDKGKHGGIAWNKKLLGQAFQDFKTYYEIIGKPEKGKIFPFSEEQIRLFVTECYIESMVPEHLYKGMPDHIWRHTGAQDLLDATGWNYAIVALTGGWVSVQVLKDRYGAMPPEAQENAVRIAMGFPIVEKRREFAF